MKITLVKIVTPKSLNEKGMKVLDLNLRTHTEYKTFFIDPWVVKDSIAFKQKTKEIFWEMTAVNDQTTSSYDVKADLVYTINGKTHLHQEGTPYYDEIGDFLLADRSQYYAIVDAYAAGHSVVFIKYKNGHSKDMDNAHYNRSTINNGCKVKHARSWGPYNNKH